MFELFHCQVCWEFKQGQPPETSFSSVPEIEKMKIWILLSRSTGLGSKEIWRHNFAFKLIKGKKKLQNETDSLTLSATTRVCVCVCVCVVGQLLADKLLPNFSQGDNIFATELAQKMHQRMLPDGIYFLWNGSLWHFCSPGAFASKVLSAPSFPIVHIPGRNQAIFLDPSIIQLSLPFQDLHSPYRLHHFIKHTLPCLPGLLSPFWLPLVYARLPFLGAVAPSTSLSCKHKLGLPFHSLLCSFYNVNWKLVKWERNYNAGIFMRCGLSSVSSMEEHCAVFSWAPRERALNGWVSPNLIQPSTLWRPGGQNHQLPLNFWPRNTSHRCNCFSYFHLRRGSYFTFV